jgi:hypothetical protein
MSFERKISAAAPVREIGARPDPATIGSGGELVIEGQELQVSDRGHEDHGQTIHRHFEQSTRPLTSVYREDGGISADAYSAYVLRADGSLNVSLGKPPSVPSNQVPLVDIAGNPGKPRTRFWRMTALIFSKSDSTIDWPADVKWTGDGQPPNPRPAGTADLFEMAYIERTGEWWVHATHVGIVSEDPQEQDPDATTPPEEDKEEDGDPAPEDNPPDNTYTDPDTGETLVPERPLGKPGNLVALHSGILSVSEDCGANWRVVRGLPENTFQIAVVKGLGAVARAAGRAHASKDLKTWTPLVLQSEQDSIVSLPNGDFESGDLTEWTVDDGAPAVLSTAQPPQRGGQHYLTRDNNTPSDQPFSVTRRLEVPAGEITLTADMLAMSGAFATATLSEIIPAAAIDGSFQHFDFRDTRLPNSSEIQNTGDEFIVPDQYRHSTGEMVNVRWRIVKDTNYFADGIKARDDGRGFNARSKSNSDREYILRVSFEKNGLPFQVSGAFDITSIVSRDGAADDEIWVGNATIEPINDVLQVATTQSEYTNFEQVPVYRGTSPSGTVRVRFDSVDHFHLALSGEQAGGAAIMLPVGAVSEGTAIGQTASIEATNDGIWSEYSAAIVLDQRSEIEIRLSGMGDAYFDNIVLGQKGIRGEFVSVVSRSLGSFLIGTQQSIYARGADGENERLGPAPFPSTMYLESGDAGMVASDGILLATSEDGGVTWIHFERPESLITPDAVPVQLFSNGALYALYTDGSILAIFEGSLVSHGNIAPGSRLTYSRRIQKWLTASTTGDVRISADLIDWEPVQDMPQGGLAPRRILATDIGRIVGWGDDSKDLFYAEDPTAKWTVGYSLTAPIRSIQEVR